VDVFLDIVPDEYEPYATLSARNGFDELLAEVRVAAAFKFDRRSAQNGWTAASPNRSSTQDRSQHAVRASPLHFGESIP
jgi:hypothetical protein